MQHGTIVSRIVCERRLGLLGGLLRKLFVERQLGLPAACTDPASLDLLGRGDGEKPGGLAVVSGLVNRLRLQGHGLGIGAVQAGIVEAVVDPQGDGNKPRTAARQELKHRDGTWPALRFLLLGALGLAGLLIGVLSAIADLGRAECDQRPQCEKSSDGPAAGIAV